MNRITNANATYLNAGLLILRLGIGFSFIYAYGFAKITDPSRWPKLGSNMEDIGVNFAPAFWGFMAAFSESFGALFLGLGLFSRIASFLLAFTMLIAFISGLDKEFNSHAFEMMIVFIASIITGPGKFSLDASISGFKK